MVNCGAVVGYFQLNIDNFVYLRTVKDKNEPRLYRIKLLSEGFYGVFTYSDFRGSYSLGQTLIYMD